MSDTTTILSHDSILDTEMSQRDMLKAILDLQREVAILTSVIEKVATDNDYREDDTVTRDDLRYELDNAWSRYNKDQDIIESTTSHLA